MILINPVKTIIKVQGRALTNKDYRSITALYDTPVFMTYPWMIHKTWKGADKSFHFTLSPGWQIQHNTSKEELFKYSILKLPLEDNWYFHL